MKFSTTILFTLILGLFMACSNNEKKPAGATAPQPADNTAPTITPPPNINANTSAAPAGVQHYICPNNCAGSGGPAAGTCPTCGTAYVHNTAFHNQSTPGADNSPMIQQPQQEAPAQNAAGVYHYTCPSGCAGGSGTAGTCPQCGGTLAHNQAYHQ